MKLLKLGSIFPNTAIEEILRIGPNHDELRAFCARNIDLINENTGQDNDPIFIAYALEYTLKQMEMRR